MKITAGALPGTGQLSKVAEITPTEPVSPGTTAPAQADSGVLQSAALQPALDTLRALPDFDHAKVAALRDALQKGEVAFDPARLAGLIQRFHGGER